MFETGAEVASSPAIGVDGTVYIGSDDGMLYAVSADGTLIWASDTGDDVRSSPSIAPDGTVYVGSHSRAVYALRGGPPSETAWTKFRRNDRNTGRSPPDSAAR